MISFTDILSRCMLPTVIDRPARPVSGGERRRRRREAQRAKEKEARRRAARGNALDRTLRRLRA